MDKLNINTIPPVNGHYWFIPRWAIAKGHSKDPRYWSIEFHGVDTERDGLFVGPLEPPIGVELPTQETEVPHV